jgi:hypothetical protein
MFANKSAKILNSYSLADIYELINAVALNKEAPVIGA